MYRPKTFPTIFAAFCGLLFVCRANAQRVAPFAYPGTAPVNYVRTWEAKAPQTDGNTILATASTDSFLMTTQYVDGLGRPVQTVAKGVTPSGKDLVTAITYDEFGREQYKYLPFAANTFGGNTSVSDGLFKRNPFQQDSVFSKAQYPGENYFYSQVIFEASPLNRALEIFAPGDSWAGTAGQALASGRRSVKTEYLINTASDSVRIWTAGSNPADAPVASSVYPAGELFKNVTKDETGKAMVEYKDKEGKVILKKVQLDALPGTAHVGWLCTYYVYDDLSQLRFVLPPKAVELINNTWSISTTIRDELCFYYGYDGRGRMIIKKVPGAGEVWMVYDKRDRLVMSQDANVRNTNKWLVTLYDELNRPVKTGLYTSSPNRAAHQGAADATTGPYPFAWDNTPSSDFELLTQTGYDDYEGLPLGCPSASLETTNITSTNFFTTYNAAPDFAQAIARSSQTKGMVTWAKAKILGTSSDFLYTVTLYDEKGRVIQVKSTNITGGTDVATTQYDFAGKAIRSHVAQQRSGTNANIFQLLTKMTYDAGGRLLTVKKRVSSNAVATNDNTVVQNTYDEPGQLKSKKIGADYNNGAGMETMSYDYNIRGWLLGANRDYAKSTATGSNWFGFDLGYDKPGIVSGSTAIGSYTQAAYNGNIAGMVWKSKGDNDIRKYDFSYDPVNRLTGADFNQYTSGSFNKNAGLDFSLTGVSYDANGNLLTLNQKGWKLTGSATIDSLVYTYINSGNRLLNVIDRMNDTATRLGDFRSSKLYMDYLGNNKTTANANAYADYGYDLNGNLTNDRNKDIGQIEYNHLNLPARIWVKGPNGIKGTVTYTYDAAGNKLQKIVTENGISVSYNGSTYNDVNVTTTTDYIGGFVYERKAYDNGSLTPLAYTAKLQFTGQEEGRIRALYKDVTNPNRLTGFVYDYMLKDHLGNVRALLTDEQDTARYPAATMETAQAGIEEALYTQLAQTRTNKPASYPEDMNGYSTTPDYKVALLNGSGNKIGPGILLKVTAGDRFNVRVTSWYRNTTKRGNTVATPGSPVSVLTDLVTLLSSNVPAASHGLISPAQMGNAGAQLQSQAQQFLTMQNGYAANRPKAFVNWLLLDEQMRFVKSSSGFEQVPEEWVYQNWTLEASAYQHLLSNRSVDKSGYLYIYTSNETPNVDVFFDNLQVTHLRGPLLEETHYYPFGLTMAGISSKAAGRTPNKERTFQGQRFDDELDLNWVQFKWRNHDPQIGRFIEIDPLAEDYEYNSTYAFSENKVTNHVELEGLEAISADIFRQAQTAPPQAKPVFYIIGGLVLFGEFIVNEVKHPTPTAPPVPGGLGIPGLDPLRKAYTSPNVVKATPAQQEPTQQEPPKPRSASDQKLIDEAKAQKAKEEKAQQNQQNKQQATQRANERTGNSNQEVMGDHNNTQGGGGKAKQNQHEEANTRRAREQQAANERKKKS